LISGITFDDISPNFLSPSKLKTLLDFLNDNSVLCTFFVVPDCALSRDSEFAACLRYASASGHELSLHGYRHVRNEFGYLLPVPFSVIPLPTLEEQEQRIANASNALVQLIGVRPLGFRAPFYLYNGFTLKALSSLGFKYDSSSTLFKPAHAAHFRVKWFGKSTPQRIQGLIEIPVTGDYTYNLTDVRMRDCVERTVRDFNWVECKRGVFVMNIHPDRLGCGLLSTYLLEIIKRLRGKTEFTRLKDVNL